MSKNTCQPILTLFLTPQPLIPSPARIAIRRAARIRISASQLLQKRTKGLGLAGSDKSPAILDAAQGRVANAAVGGGSAPFALLAVEGTGLEGFADEEGCEGEEGGETHVGSYWLR